MQNWIDSNVKHFLSRELLREANLAIGYIFLSHGYVSSNIALHIKRLNSLM